MTGNSEILKAQLMDAVEAHSIALLNAQAWLNSVLTEEQQQELLDLQKECKDTKEEAGKIAKELYVQDGTKSTVVGIVDVTVDDITPYDDAAIIRDWKDKLPVNCLTVNKTELNKFPVEGLDVTKYKTKTTKLSATVQTKDKAMKAAYKKIEWMCDIHNIPREQDMADPSAIEQLGNWLSRKINEYVALRQ